jgi:hypothetical protein
MTIKFPVLLALIALASICVVQAQTFVPAELPAESPSPAKKHRQHKRAEATASLAETAASPATAESLAASPKARQPGKRAQTEAAATPVTNPAASPTASPRFRLGDFFKPKASLSAATYSAAVTGGTGTATPAPGGGRGLVWVNTETHLYHKEASRFYGTTKKGKYVSEADAIKEGDKEAPKRQRLLRRLFHPVDSGLVR